MTAPPDPRPLLTIERIDEMRAEYEVDLRLLAEVQQRLREKKQLWEAAMMFVPSTLKTDLPDEQCLAPEEKPARLRSGSHRT